MLNRIEGLIVLGNTALPPVLAVIVLGLFLAHKHTVATAWSEASASLSGIAAAARQSEAILARMRDDVGAELEKADESLENIADRVNPAIAAIDSGATAIKELELSYVNGVSSKKLTLLKKDVVYWVSPQFGDWAVGATVAQPFENVSAALGQVTAPFDRLGKAVALYKQNHQQRLEAEIRALRGLAETAWQRAETLAGAAGRIATTLSYLAVGFFVWFVLGYGFWARRRLLRGWELVRRPRHA